MPLIDKDAARIAAALDDYENVSLKEVRPRSGGFFEVVVTDHRFDVDYALASHCDYWDFVGSVVSNVPYPSVPLAREVA
ncbi:MAG: hypothetical protein M3285_01050 [Actinomycetota bacterium]|nr:hypothetical protein [Actinomycetota bacterium]MDQ3954123.1 hypothetical protein [Actinomycetota bacterium]